MSIKPQQFNKATEETIFRKSQHNGMDMARQCLIGELVFKYHKSHYSNGVVKTHTVKRDTFGSIYSSFSRQHTE